MFSDCFTITIIPDISKWKNYNEKNIKKIPNYNQLNDIFNFNYMFVSSTPQEKEIILKDPNYLEDKLYEKMKRFNLIQ